jgi:putative phosphoribosyl transferase
MRFRDRRDAGRRLAFALRRWRDEAPIVLGLPRGGVPVAYEVARALGAPLDVWVVRKIGAPGHEELGLGAVAEGGEVFLNQELCDELGLDAEATAKLAVKKRAEVDARVRALRRDKPAPELAGRTVILVDDGIATGGTVRAALRSIRAKKPRRIILATPVGAASSIEALRPDSDEVVVLDEDPFLSSIGVYYEDFAQTTDDEVIDLLERARDGGDVEVEIVIDADGALLPGVLAIPRGAFGLVLFAHGSGSSRHSPRNRYVADALGSAGLGTLLFDLLTPEEEAEDEVSGRLRFDVEFLAQRLVAATDFVRARPEALHLPFGCFGASTGAAAALIAAAERPDLFGAVVSRGGRPDLAEGWLDEVSAPTLLIVGAADTSVLALNRSAFAHLTGPRRLVIVPGATHLFEEPGALDEVARAAIAWFSRYLAPHAYRAAG